jgi:hypothetical protein
MGECENVQDKPSSDTDKDTVGCSASTEDTEFSHKK